MKVVAAKEMGRIERAAYAAGAKEEAFMEEAGRGVAQYAGYLHKEKKITLLCGNGNNAGDAYVAGRLLQERGYSVKAYSLSPLEKCTPLCQLQAKRFGKVNQIVTADELELEGLLIDGILGTGFYGVVDGLFRDMIEKANASKLPILSIDIPSGVNGTTGEVGGVAIRATFTLFLGLP
ncbi:MAG: NAD(P)H-hydrate epimerase, partial [Chlamydiales bacterium]